MDKQIWIIWIGMFLIVGGCHRAELEPKENLVEEQAEETIAIVQEVPETYQFFIESQDYILGLYEPPQGAYAGAYILSNAQVNFDIETFEAKAGNHAIYRYHMRLGESFPISWVLSCISNEKTPYITISTENFYDTDLLEETAKQFGEYYIPIFVEFAQVEPHYDPESYIRYYRQARSLFRTYASNVAFVWGIKMEEAFDFESYYPGDDYVDWVGIKILQTLRGQDEYGYDVLNAIDAFYKTYHQKKPIFAHLAVSHFSSYDYVYRTSLAAAELTRLYKYISESYPRIKGVIYLDFNAIEIPLHNEIQDNFSITSDENILAVYKALISDKYFLDVLDIISTGDQNTELFVSPVLAYKLGGRFYFPDFGFKSVLGISDISGPEQYIRHHRHFSLDILEERGLGSLEIDEYRKRIIFRRA